MCPDPQVLSLYHDGELPSPWKEKLESHLSDCAPCKERLEGLRQLSGALGEGADSRVDADAAMARVWRRLNSPEALSLRAKAQPKTRTPAWSRSVPVPLPLLLAAAALILAFGVFFARSPRNAAPADSALAVGLDMQTIVPVSDLSGVLQYLGNDDSPDIVIIRLPESRSFLRSGEPAIIKAADYGGGSR